MPEYVIEKAEAEARALISEATGVALQQLQFSQPKDAAHGDLSSGVCFQLARERKKNPKDLAEEIAGKIAPGKHSFFSSVAPAGGYLNFFFSAKFFSESLAEAISLGEKFGSSVHGAKKTAVVEYSSPNIGKPMHVGHIRSTILGDSLRRVLAFCGYKAIGTNYLCEAGLQTAKLILALRTLKQGKVETEKDLLQYYIKIHEVLEGNPEFLEEAHKIVEEMESGAQVQDLMKARELSLKPFNRNYSRLGVHFDEQVFDSDFVELGKKIVLEAQQKGIARKDEGGEVFADLEASGLPNLVILRSNGTTLYSTRDLALPDSDFGKYGFELRVYVVGSEQKLTLAQSWKILELLGRPYAKKLVHVPFGLIYLEGGKISSRKGQVVFLEDVLDDAHSSALGEVRKKQDYDEKTADEIAEKVGIASLKYSVLKLQAEKNITFNLQEAVNFDGNTAAYLQYTCVRAKKILEKAGTAQGKPTIPVNHSFDDEEKKVVLQLSRFPSVVSSCAKNLEVHGLCNYLFGLATQFSSFYEKRPVLKAEDVEKRAARLAIVAATLTAMGNGLQLLGIEVPEKM